MGIRLSSFPDAAAQKRKSRREEKAGSGAAPSRPGLRSSAQQKQSERIDPRVAQRGRAEKQAGQVHLRYRTKLLFIWPLITLMEVPLWTSVLPNGGAESGPALC